MIQVDSLRRQFGSRILFDELSWMIPRGARMGLVGPDGAGNRTLLRIIAGLDAPDRGRVHAPTAARSGYLPQEVEAVSEGSVLTVVLQGFQEICKLEQEIERAEERLASLGPEDPGLAAATA